MRPTTPKVPREDSISGSVARLCSAKVPRGRRKRKPFPAAISYGSDFLPPVKNSRCGIVSHAAAMGIGGGIHTEDVSVAVGPKVAHSQETWKNQTELKFLKLKKYPDIIDVSLGSLLYKMELSSTHR